MRVARLRDTIPGAGGLWPVLRHLLVRIGDHDRGLEAPLESAAAGSERTFTVVSLEPGPSAETSA